MSVGPLRSVFLAIFAPYVRDVVITGHDRDDIGMMIFADADACCFALPHARPQPICRGNIFASARNRALSRTCSNPQLQIPPAAPTASLAPSSWTSRRRSTPEKSLTKARSISARSWIAAPRRSQNSTRRNCHCAFCASSPDLDVVAASFSWAHLT